MNVLDSDGPLLGIDETAKYLGVTRRCVRELYLRRKIRGAKPNYRTWVFRKPDLDSYLERIATRVRGAYT